MNPLIIAAIVTTTGVVLAALVTGFFSIRARGDSKATKSDRGATATTRRHIDATTKSWLAIMEDVTVRLEECEEARAQDGVEKGTLKREGARMRAEIVNLRAKLEEPNA